MREDFTTRGGGGTGEERKKRLVREAYPKTHQWGEKKREKFWLAARKTWWENLGILKRPVNLHRIKDYQKLHFGAGLGPAGGGPRRGWLDNQGGRLGRRQSPQPNCC